MSKIYLNMPTPNNIKINRYSRLSGIVIGLSLLLMGLFSGHAVQAQLLGWNLVTNNNALPSFGSTTTNANLFTSFITRGAGITPIALINAFNSNDWASATQAAAEAADEYFQFTVQPQVGFTTSLSNMSYKLRRSSSGPDKYIWKYSTDGVNFIDIPASQNLLFTTTLTNGLLIAPITLSTIPALQNVPNSKTITFRLYAWGATGTGGTFAIGRSLVAGPYPPATPENSLIVNGTTAAGGPTISVSPATLLTSNYVFSFGPGTTRSFTVGGSNLTGFPDDINLAAPTDYEMSLDNFATAGVATIDLPYTAATMSAVTVYARLKAGLAVGSYDSETIDVTGGGATGKTVTCDGTVTPFFSALSDVVAVAASESPTISSLQNDAAPLTSVTGAKAWEFTIRDGGAAMADPDPLPTIVTSITLAAPAANQVTWLQAIKTVSLFDGATLLATGVVTAGQQIQFTGMTFTVPDNGFKTLTLRLSLNCGIGAANTDGDDFVFSLSAANFTTASNLTSSQKSAFSAAASTNSQNVISVVATRLAFTVQPTNAGVNTAIAPAVVVVATDACGNRDINYVSTVTITSTGSLSSAQAKACVAGVATFAAISFNAPGANLTLTANAPLLSTATSNFFDITISTKLNPGDLMIVGFDTYSTGVGGDDRFSIANLVDLIPGTEFSMANMCYELAAPANTVSGKWYSGNGNATAGASPPYLTIRYNGAANLPKGKTICIKISGSGVINPATDITVNGVVSTDFSVPVPAPALNSVQFSSTDPDAIFLMQGTFSADQTETIGPNTYTYKTFAGTVFGAIQTRFNFRTFNQAGDDGTTHRVSRVYPSLECISIAFPAASGVIYGFYKNSALHNGTQHNLIANIGNLGSNWTFNTGGSGNDELAATSCATAFTVTLPVAYGYWTPVNATSKDWFNCANWDNFAVPDNSINVTIDAVALADCQIDANTSAKAAQFGNKADAKSVTINGRKLIVEYTGAIQNRLDLTGNMNINALNGLDMSDGTANVDGVLNIQGNWNNSNVSGFTRGESLVNFNGTVPQTITSSGAETFYNLTNSNTSTGVTMLPTVGNVTVSNLLSLANGILSISDNTLTLNGTISGAGTLSGSASSNLVIGGAVGTNVGTLNFTAGSQELGNLTLNRTGAGGAATLGTSLSIAGLATITAGSFDAGTNTFDGAGNLTMTNGDLQLGKTGTTVPELTGTYTLTGGEVIFKGAADQTIRGVNYFKLTSTSMGTRAMQNSGSVGIASIFTPGTNTYSFTGSTVDYNGPGAQNIVAFTSGAIPGSSYDNLTLSNAGVKTMLDNTDVEGALSLNNSITLFVGPKFLNMKSFATQTARVAPVSASANIIYTGLGSFVIERYFPGNRAWRLITAPVTVTATKTLFNSWQLGGNNSISGSGTFITGPNELPNGFDVSPLHNYSLKRFNQTNSQFDGVGNTKGANLISGTLGVPGVPDNRSFFMFVRGDRTAANINVFNSYGAVNATTLRDTGKIQTQSYVFPCNTNVGVNKYTLIGNPYASPVDFASLTRNNVANKFQAWDPTLNSVGGYVIVDLALGSVVTVPVGGLTTQTQIIQSKQAFLVETTNATSPSVGFSEAAKSSVNNLNLFRPIAGAVPSLSVNLNIRNADGTIKLADGILAQFRSDFAAGVDQLDGVKFGNVNETFGIEENNNLLMLSRRPAPITGDSIFFSIKRSRQLNYQFDINGHQLQGKNLSAWLADRFLGTNTPVSLDGITTVNFSVTGNVASAASNRFYIYFKQAFKFNQVRAEVVSRDVAVSWSLLEETDVNRYEVERSTDGETFSRVGTVNAEVAGAGLSTYHFIDVQPAAGIYYYRIKGISNTQAAAYTSTVKVKVSVTKANVYVYPNPVSGGTIGLQMNALPVGTYSVKLVNASGQMVLNSQLIHSAGTATESIAYPASLTAGTYQLELTGRDRRAYLVPVVIDKQ